jgi:rhodanese-related sulfurtransferase
MKSFTKSILFFVIAITLASTLSACASGRASDVPVATVQQLVGAKSANVAIIDVNDDETRATKGIVPGAIKLSSYDKFSMNELPADKNATLVFYCYNSLCPASGLAADRAIDAGYKDVRVMKAGIIGWNDAAKKAKG